MNLTELYTRLREEKEGNISVNREIGLITVTNTESPRGFDCYRLTGELGKDTENNEAPLIEEVI